MKSECLAIKNIAMYHIYDLCISYKKKKKKLGYHLVSVDIFARGCTMSKEWSPIISIRFSIISEVHFQCHDFLDYTK